MMKFFDKPRVPLHQKVVFNVRNMHTYLLCLTTMPANAVKMLAN